MGDRIVYTFKQSDGKELSLYSHWGGYNRFRDLAYAIDKARPRWDDESYAARIMISNLIGPDWEQETGFGLWAGGDTGGGDHAGITIHLDYKAVEDETGYHYWEDFISYHMIRLDTGQNAVV